MDTLRDNFADHTDEVDELQGYETIEDNAERDAPPANIGQDERRMQVRAYNHWASLLEGRNYPAIEDLEPETLTDFGPYSVLLDFTGGIEDPGISYLGEELGQECGASTDIHSLNDVPSRSLLSRITDHYMQILANQAPIGFEAEFVNQRGATIMYRGILLPYSSDDDTIDFIFGVINWKEMADQKATDELLLEIDQALDEADLDDEAQDPEENFAPDAKDTISDWADGPASDDAFADSEAREPLHDPDLGEVSAHGEDHDAAHADNDDTEAEEEDTGPSLLRLNRIVPSYDDDDDDDDGEYLPRPSFGFADRSQSETGGKTPIIFHTDDDAGNGAADASFDAGMAAPDAFADYSEATALPHSGPDSEPDLPILPQIAESDMELGDWLASARELAANAINSEDRSRGALYDAIGKAYDFSLVASQKPEEFSELLEDFGLNMQERAPMTPVVKLVFGADYDKTRLTEYATALSHAHRMGVQRGELSDLLTQCEGGLKGVVQAERRLRKEESGQKVEPADRIREALARKLRRLPTQDFDMLAEDGQEFALVMVRRTEDGEVLIVGEIPQDVPLIERAARKLLR